MVDYSGLLLNESHSYKADFTMGALDYQRFHQHLMNADMLTIAVINRNIEAIRPFYSVIKVLWFSFRTIVPGNFRDLMDAKMNKIEILFKHWNSINAEYGKTFFPNALVDALQSLYADLLMTKQYIGLGVKVSRNESERTKMKRAMGLLS